MSVSNNPYQAPLPGNYVYEPLPDKPTEGLWRQGKLLVMHKMAPLPARCVKSNVPTERRLKRSLSWHHPAIYLAVLLHVLIYILLALILRKRATIYIGLSDEWYAKRFQAMIIGWGSVLASIGIFIAGVALVGQNGAFGWLFVLALILFLFGAIYGLIGARMVTATKIDENYVWLKGVCPEFLAGLPEWPAAR